MLQNSGYASQTTIQTADGLSQTESLPLEWGKKEQTKPKWKYSECRTPTERFYPLIAEQLKVFKGFIGFYL